MALAVPFSFDRFRPALRVALSYYVANGASVAVGLLVISAIVHMWLGAEAAAAAGIGAIVVSPPDLPSPRRIKLRQMLPAPLFGLPLFFAVQWLSDDPAQLGLLLVPCTFLAFLAMAWGKRGIPIAIAVMFAMIFSMAVPAQDDWHGVLRTTGHFAIGAFAGVVWAVATNALLNGRYRVQFIADTLLSVASLMRAQAARFEPIHAATTEERIARADAVTSALLARQAALADQLQAARDLVLETPGTPRRQQLAALLMMVLELRDHLVASELDVDLLHAHTTHASALASIGATLPELAEQVERMADSMLMLRKPARETDLRPRLDALRAAAGDVGDGSGNTDAATLQLLRGLADRMGHINDEVQRMVALARGDTTPDLAVVRASWQMFVSPAAWSIAPFLALWRWDAPPLRHAIRAALAIAAGYIISLVLPWKSHPYWIFLTIVLVLRGSFAQTVERRDARVAGTLLGSVLAVLVLRAHLTHAGILAVMTVSQAIAHGFAIRRYIITAVAATILGLVQAHLLNTGASTTLALMERVADTVLGAGIAWAFSYLLPSWERGQIPALVQRTVLAQARHAREALALGQLSAVDNGFELRWRLARREAYDSLSALVQATQRSLAEPRAVRPPLVPLERLQARSYQLLAQMSAAKSILLLRRDHLRIAAMGPPLAAASARIETTLAVPAPKPATMASPAPTGSPMPEQGIAPGIPTPAAAAPDQPAAIETPASELEFALLRRLSLCEDIAVQLRQEADVALEALRRSH
ncbi:FUSC family membrane protein [Variovorax sp. VNK109]|uniref:FUSC family protein n=1 Tax=Variovorax sp. VNK109 TaxID=3400919 RepID=UPI003C00107A